jgi:hypothetical protein
MNKIISIILILSLNIVAFADCPDAVKLNVGDKVTDCERIGLSGPAEKKIREDLIGSDYNAKKLEEQKKILDLKDQVIADSDKQVVIWKQEVDRERLALDVERARTKWEFWGGIILGIGFTALGAWSVGQVHR